MWALVHALLLNGFRNRLMVMREWVWAYFTRSLSARLITGDTDAPTRKPRQVEADVRPEPDARGMLESRVVVR
jgi:hypothetical protein